MCGVNSIFCTRSDTTCAASTAAPGCDTSTRTSSPTTSLTRFETARRRGSDAGTRHRRRGALADAQADGGANFANGPLRPVARRPWSDALCLRL
jgi:hypothetical protein